MNIVGISAHYHESACCLLKDGVLVAAAEEERFSRVKHDARLPVSAFRFCLQEGAIDIGDIDCVAYYESPVRKLGRQLWSGHRSRPGLPWMDGLRPEREIREVLGYEGPIEVFEHHRSHAASAFCYSGFDDAAILTVDGVGEWATTCYGSGTGDTLDVFEEVEFPHSLGLFYSTLTSYLGFEVNDGEYKVMGLAPYGRPRYVDQMRELVVSGTGGGYRLNLDYFDFVGGERMPGKRLPELFGQPAREKESAIDPFHQDVARSAQQVLEEVLLEKVAYLASRVDSENLCMAGGVALNCVANARILREGPFRRLFVQPAAGDSGASLGAAALAHVKLSGGRHTRDALSHVYLGPGYSSEWIGALLQAIGLDAVDCRGDERRLVDAVAQRLASGGVVGWFQGRMEFGPRALGARSILADPRDPEMRERLNRLVKKREAFRPFAPSVLADRASDYFDLDHPSGFMLETAPVRSAERFPAITHVDGSARPQTVDPVVAPRFAALIERFAARTGCPLLVNTSFNVRGEPIVESPMDALSSMVDSGLDALAIEDFLIDRESIGDALAALLRNRTELHRVAAIERPTSAVYTFI